MFSILISVYHKETASNLHEALFSLLGQDYAPEDEIILVQDGPLPDALHQVISQFINKLPIKTVVLLANVGLPGALNRGVQEASQPWIMRFDSDDLCVSDRLARQKAHAFTGEFDFFGAQIVEFDAQSKCATGQRRVPIFAKDIIARCYQRSPFNHVTMCIRRDILLKHPYPEIIGLEDYALWVHLISQGYRFGNTDEVVVWVRAGVSMLKRRSGLIYLLQEIRFRKYMLAHTGFNSLKVIFYGVIRCAAFLLPMHLKVIAYRKILRV